MSSSRKLKVQILLSVDFDAVSGFLGTGASATTNLADYSSGFFAAQVGVPRLLRLFKKHGISSSVTWFVPGHSMESFPEETKAIVQSGAEIGCHGYAHEGSSQMTESQEREVIAKCVQLATDLTGKKPRGWRAPLYQLRTHTIQVLEEFGFLYDSSLTHHDSSLYFIPRMSEPKAIDFSPSKSASTWMKPLPAPGARTPQTLVEIPCNWYMEDMTPLGYLPAAPNSHGFVSPTTIEQNWKSRFAFLYSEALEKSIEEDSEQGFVFPLILHPDTSGMAHVVGMIDRMILWLKQQGDEVEFVTFGECAAEFGGVGQRPLSATRDLQFSLPTSTISTYDLRPWQADSYHVKFIYPQLVTRMPRRKAADRTGPVKTRSRDGCKECRASRVRCDTKKPLCTRCRQKGLPCTKNLVLKWESEFISRGVAFGRAGIWNKTGAIQPTHGSVSSEMHEWCPVPTISPWGFINSGVSTFEHPDEVNVDFDELNALISVTQSSDSPFFRNHQIWSWLQHFPHLRGLSLNFNPSLPPSLALFPELSKSGHGELFDYYLQQVCPRTTASSTFSSPFASVILPFCLSASPTLFKAIQALGACHWSRRNPSYGAIGLRFKSEALRDLRRRLSSEGTLTCSMDPEVLVIMIMLCLYEIVDKCDQQWIIHLKGANDLIRLRRKQQIASSQLTAPLDPVTTFAEQFFAFQDVMGRTACAKEVLFGTDYWKPDERNIDLWMGCSPELVSILAKITDMSRTRRQNTSEADKASFSLRAASLERQLENLVQEVGEGDEEMLGLVADSKRLAAMLYLHCSLYGAGPTTPLVKSYVRQILRVVSDLLDRKSLVNVTWPVFVAAVELDPSDDELCPESEMESGSGRAIVLRSLATLADSTISNIARTRAVITKLWQTRDSDLIKGTTLQNEYNDWEWHVVPISNAMSLA
ncbi:Fungal transcriptional regulatory protein, N-terminal [Penicillium camemberti]|uniref:Fungal transcriptional regulatory protein, N-terminal n=1 Tax=Penicillium camemberti (strain FM 013) TaxID=1429867 RepID=A0A0G4PSQ8_PENC3|nr:Fungal transcriptional regulatory protein, N-terminal [Penicillium camemberti]